MIKKISSIIFVLLCVATFAYGHILVGLMATDCLYDDYFHTINATYWTEVDTNTELDVVSGELNFNSSGTAESQGYVTSIWYFNANVDFDVRIDFNDISWTAGDPASPYFNELAIEIKDGVDTYVTFGRSITDGDVEQYYYKGSTSAYTGIAGAVSSGRLRVTYTDGTDTLTLYYWDAGESRWEWNDNAAGVSPAESFADDTIQIRLYFIRRAAAGGNTYNGDMDNFKVVNGCENITLP